jgi:uncharacterized protein YdhG (YjbR/CyaY superfamily)
MPASKQGTATDKIWTKEEQDAIKESARERKSQAKRTPEQEREAGEQEVKSKIAEMPAAERTMAERIHAIVQDTVPELVPRTYYGMPAYATAGKDGKTICFFQPASKFKVRYSTLGFQPDAKIDDGNMWPIAWALTELTAADEKKIAALVKKAVE